MAATTSLSKPLSLSQAAKANASPETIDEKLLAALDQRIEQLLTQRHELLRKMQLRRMLERR